jgi:uncharacterized MAPEG superfamily protein
MTSFENYDLAMWGILLIMVTVLVQALVGSLSKATQPGAVPGKIDDSLSHASFVFRAHRTFLNSLENLPLMLGASFLAMFVGASPSWTAALVWIFAGARLGHMILYYKIVTEKNPSPRTYFFLLGLVANIALLILAGTALL